jgi:hypothetical protein
VFDTAQDATFTGNITFSDGKNIVIGTGTGTKFGTSGSQKIGFFGATPVTQRSNIGSITDATGGSSSGSVNDVGLTYNQMTLNNNFATLVNRISNISAVLSTLGLTL